MTDADVITRVATVTVLLTTLTFPPERVVLALKDGVEEFSLAIVKKKDRSPTTQ